MATLRRDRLDGDIEVLRLDRPPARNAPDSATLAELVPGANGLRLRRQRRRRRGGDRRRL
jgi:enoyl-CoA hydratase/carnithine racemase